MVVGTGVVPKRSIKEADASTYADKPVIRNSIKNKSKGNFIALRSCFVIL